MIKEVEEKGQKNKEMEKEINYLEKTIQMNKEVKEKKQEYKEMEKKMNKIKENAKYLVPQV